jgi:hypothetical protein
MRGKKERKQKEGKTRRKKEWWHKQMKDTKRK